MQKIIVTIAVILLFGLGFVIFSFFQNSGLLDYDPDFKNETTNIDIENSN